MIPLDLPEPGPDGRAHSARVASAVRAAIDEAGGWLSFAEFMGFVLYAPGLGYYSAGSAKFGRDGDFVTAPELSGVFGRCLAAAIAPVLAQVDGGDVLELGAGTGRLACDVLVALERLDRLPREYRILEVSADLRERQRARIAALPSSLARRVRWLDALPDGHSGVVLANEVADALPVARFRRGADGVEELGVVADAEGFRWSARPAGDELVRAVDVIEATLGERLEPGYESEVALGVPAWIASLAAVLGRGALFLLDYGLARADYYAPSRDGGTLACFYRHRVHSDPFVHLGIQDLTAWVDFTRLAEAGLAAGLEVGGYTTQAHFLLDSGFDEALAAELDGREGAARHAANQAALTLVLPGEMGERFKCLALERGVDCSRGFGLRDFSARL